MRLSPHAPALSQSGTRLPGVQQKQELLELAALSDITPVANVIDYAVEYVPLRFVCTSSNTRWFPVRRRTTVCRCGPSP